jgi:hypothetical protein
MRKQDCRALYAELTGYLEDEESLVDALAVGLATPEISRLLGVSEEWWARQECIKHYISIA